MHVLVLNAGSSSLKLRVIGDDRHPVAAADLDRPDDEAGLERFLASAPAVGASGHRVVHGGGRFTDSVVVDDGVLAAIDELSDLAPLHNPPALAAFAAVARLRPALPAVACFDTAFHSTLPPAAATYPLPAAWRDGFGVRRFGFHGLSHRWVAARTAELLERPVETVRLVSCHLGSGASLAAISGGRSVDTTMGFTPLEGVVMATRSGSVDPGALLWLLERRGLTPADVADGLEHHSGLVGLAGTGDMREVLAAAAAGVDGATLALEVYGHRLRAGIAAMAAALGGVDAITFTGGIGEHAARVRGDALAGLAFLGVAVDTEANEGGAGDRLISPSGAAVAVAVVEAREDLSIAADVRRLLGA